MDYSIKVTSSEQEHIKSIIKKDYLKKFDESTFEQNYETYLNMPEFSAMWSIYDENNNLKEEYKWFNKSVHFIMRLIAQYHINQALKAWKFDTSNDVNLSTDWGSNIGTAWRISKVWLGDKLDNSTFSEFGDWRFVPAPRLAVFPVDTKLIVGTFSDEGTNNTQVWVIKTEEDEYVVKKFLKWNVKVYELISQETNKKFYIDRVDFDTSKKEININVFPEQEIVVKTIQNPGLGSVCSHHGLPYFLTDSPDSRIVIAYKPYKYLLWISKLTRIVEFSMNRFSLQEGITDIIHKQISKASGTEDVLVGLENLVHSCEFTRWSKKATTTTTEKAEGCFKDEVLRNNVLR